MKLSKLEARALMLAAMGLDRRPKKKATRADVLRAIRRMGALQIDTIHIVARSPYFVLWSRLGEYEPRWLDELFAAGHLFEYWSHEACFVPIEDYPLYRHRMLNAASMGWKYSWASAHGDEVAQMLEYIRVHGPVRASDFKRTDGGSSGWWEWKSEKRALEMLFTSGDLMIKNRENFHRVYDLRERVLSSTQDAHVPTTDEAHRTLALKAIKALGITTPRWVSDYFRTDKKRRVETVSALLGEEAVLPVEVEGLSEPAFVHRDHRRLLKQASAGKINLELTTLLSPFDPLIWDRNRARTMFDFDYRLECYTPESKRRFGYFSLPILHRGNLVGRLDAKAHRKDGVFEIKSIHFEPNFKSTDDAMESIAGAISDCARWHKTEKVIVRKSQPTKLAKRLSKVIEQLIKNHHC